MYREVEIKEPPEKKRGGDLGLPDEETKGNEDLVPKPGALRAKREPHRLVRSTVKGKRTLLSPMKKKLVKPRRSEKSGTPCLWRAVGKEEYEPTRSQRKGNRPDSQSPEASPSKGSPYMC